jgi:hypothetical protein
MLAGSATIYQPIEAPSKLIEFAVNASDNSAIKRRLISHWSLVSPYLLSSLFRGSLL